MTERSSSPAGPDLTQGVPLADIGEGGTVTGHVGGEPALFVHQGGALSAIGAACTHYGAPLGDGLLIGDTVRCPWHHACFSLRTGRVLRRPALDDVKCWRVVRRDGSAHRCVVVGASFIGLEVAASLRTRGLEVHVVAREARPMERIFGAAISDMVKALHESHGVVFHLGATVAEIEPDRVRLSTGAELAADLVVVGIGVRPEVTLAKEAGLAVDRGVTVDAFLQTSAPGIYAAGDIARWPDPRTGDHIRVEHWVVAERQGAVAARNILGQRQRFAAVPFFWSRQYDASIDYVGHAEQWDRIDIDGDPAARDCTVTYWRNTKRLAVATVGRALDSLRAEVAFEQETPV